MLQQDKLEESYSDDVTQSYDDMGMPIHTLSPNANVIKFQENSRQNKEETDDPFKPKSGHVPGGLPMISDSAFSLTILIYVSVAFLLVFFLFCWKTNGNGTVGSSEETLKQQCPLMTNNPPEPNVTFEEWGIVNGFVIVCRKIIIKENTAIIFIIYS